MLLAANATRLVSFNRCFSGVTTVAGGHRRQSIGQLTGARFNWFAGEHTIADETDRNAVPVGAAHPVAWLPARKTGGLGSRNESDFAFSIGTLALAEGRNLEATTTITWSVPDAQLQLVVSAEGTAAITFTVADAALAGALSAEGTTSFAFTVSTSTLGAIMDALGTAGITFSGSAEATAIGHMDGDISPFTELSPESLAANVLNAVVEGEVTLAQVLRILMAHAAGDATGLETSPEFMSRDGLTTRIAGTISGGTRTITTFDPS